MSSQAVRDKARDLVLGGHVQEVESARDDVRAFSVKQYRVLLGPFTAVDCDCPAGRMRQGCSNIRACVEFCRDQRDAAA